MTKKRFYLLAEEIICSQIPTNHPVNGKDALMADLLIQGYEEDLKMIVAGKMINPSVAAITAIPLSSSIQDAQGLLVYSCYETSKKEPDRLPKCETRIRQVFNLMYVNMSMVSLVMNFNIRGKEVRIDRDTITAHLTDPVRKSLKEVQKNEARNNISFLGLFRRKMPRLR